MKEMNFVLKYMLKCMPHHAITNFVGAFMKSRLSKFAIPLYIRLYQIDVSTVERPMSDFHSLNDFFKRKLKPDARPIHSHKDVFVSPVDGVISQVGRIEDGELIQAKGVSYSVEQLLADSSKAEMFQNGSFMTIYLSPKDYHRIHAPVEGTITDYSYIPGRLYPVNKIGVTSIEGLFTKNERLSTYLDTSTGKMAIVKVGAMIVGSVQVAYQEHVERLHQGKPYKAILETIESVRKGDEIGHFEFGSTVILLFEENQIEMAGSVAQGSAIKMGEPLGYTVKKLERKVD